MMADVSPNKSGQVVLLADDSDDDVMLFKRAFKRAGISNPVCVVSDGEQAIAYLKGEGRFSNRSEYPFPTLVLLDLKMPRASGLDVLRWLRDQAQAADLPVIVMTHSQNPDAIEQAYRLGADSYIVKAVDLQDFVGELAKVGDQWLSSAE